MGKNDQKPVISLISLGCAKNTVDSERILGQLATAGFLIAEDPAEADVCLVNTCGFIHDAREESAGVLRELQKLKKDGRVKSVVALGCLVERAHGAEELNGYLASADASIGFQDYPKLPELIDQLGRRKAEAKKAADGVAVQIEDRRFQSKGVTSSFATSYAEFLTQPRLRTGLAHVAHLKISEGCSNFCRFCSIPYIRGVQVSRPMEDIVAEAGQLLDMGVKEISLIAQDTTSYGRDLYGKLRLAELLRTLSATADGREVWFRLMYAFPRFLDAEMLDVLAGDPAFCPYIDMPLQHIADRMLMNMGRGLGQRDTMRLLDLIAEKMPHGALRTTFIVGYPGETEAEFNELLALVNEGRFSHVGAFLYSKEPKTPSAQLDDNVPLAEKKRRRDALMKAQRDVSRKRLAAFAGKTVQVMIDGPAQHGRATPPGAKAMGRTKLEATEVDGVVFLKGRGLSQVEPGTILHATVTGHLDYDLVAEIA